MPTQLIVNADDFGLTESVNACVIEAFRKGNVTSATLMVNMPGTAHAAELARRHEGLAVGLHFCLTAGEPLSEAASLVDDAGRFHTRPMLMRRIATGKVDPEHIATELEAQLARFAELGLQLSHVDSHQHVHMVPFVFRAMQPVLAKHGLLVRTVRPLPPNLTLLKKAPAKWAKQWMMLRWARRISRMYPRTGNHRLVSVHDHKWGTDIHPRRYAELLRDAEPGEVVELMVHPYTDGSDVAAMFEQEPDGGRAFLAVCCAEYEALRGRKLFNDEHIAMTTYPEANAVTTREADVDDLPALADLMRREKLDAHVTADQLRHWYFDNPHGSHCIRVAMRGDRIEGMATTNNFRLRMGGDQKLAAMPQKVLTSPALRGQGVFKKLYQETEATNLEQRGVDFFITFTNELSTPIFLNRFEYVRGQSPQIVLLPWNPARLMDKRRYRRVERFDPDLAAHVNGGVDHAVVKDAAFLAWRYGGHGYVRLEVETGHGKGGLVLKRIRKKGVPIYVLMDLLTADAADVVELLRQGQRYATAHAAAGLMLMNNACTAEAVRQVKHVSLGRRFAFLVKGRSDEQTQQLSQTPFNLTFGDLDFL